MGRGCLITFLQGQGPVKLGNMTLKIFTTCSKKLFNITTKSIFNIHFINGANKTSTPCDKRLFTPGRREKYQVYRENLYVNYSKETNVTPCIVFEVMSGSIASSESQIRTTHEVVPG